MAATQPSALVTRPICSCTSTCCRAVQPPPPSSSGMFVACRPSSRARLACPAVTSAGSSPPDRSASSSKRDQLVREAAGPRLDLAVLFRQPVHPVEPPGLRRLLVLTECSVYASIDRVPMRRGYRRTPWWWAAGRWAPGARTSCAGPGWPGSCWWRRASSARAPSSRAAGVVRMQGGTPEAVRLGQWSRRFYLSQRDELGTDSGLHRAGLPAALLHRGGRRGGARADGHAVRAGRSGALARTGRGGRGQPDAGARADARRHVLRRGRVHHAAAQRGRLHRGAEPQRRRGRRARRVRRAELGRRLARFEVQTSQGPIDAGLVVLTGGPKLAAVGAAGRHARSRRAAPGTRSR